MNKLLLALALAGTCSVASARADSITGGSGPTLTSINGGSVTAAGSFGPVSITGGKGNFIGVTAAGAAVNVQILKEGGNPNAVTDDNISVSSVNAQNTGPVTATGSFNGGGNISGLSSINSGNSVGVSAAGTSVNISITKR